jgi:hypothetical protein
MNGFEDTPSIISNQITNQAGAPVSYSQLTAEEKRDYLFDHGIRATVYKKEMPGLFGGVLRFTESALRTEFAHSLGDSLTRVSDELEEPRQKLFHTFGATAKIAFTSEANTPYTGIFSSRRACGLARFSYAGPVAGVGIVPGLGLKFLIDGAHPSENVVAMRKLDPQEHHSVFQHAFTNVLPAPNFANLIMRGVKTAFETVVREGEGLHQPVDNLAQVNTDGSSVTNPVAPYRLIFKPTNQAISSSDGALDFREDLARNIASGTAIYDVCALDEPAEQQLNRQGVSSPEDLLAHSKKIGAISTESEFIASAYGDYRLFFKHSAKFIRK